MDFVARHTFDDRGYLHCPHTNKACKARDVHRNKIVKVCACCGRRIKIVAPVTVLPAVEVKPCED